MLTRGHAVQRVYGASGQTSSHIINIHHADFIAAYWASRPTCQLFASLVSPQYYHNHPHYQGSYPFSTQTSIRSQSQPRALKRSPPRRTRTPKGQQAEQSILQHPYEKHPDSPKFYDVSVVSPGSSIAPATVRVEYKTPVAIESNGKAIGNREDAPLARIDIKEARDPAKIRKMELIAQYSSERKRWFGKGLTWRDSSDEKTKPLRGEGWNEVLDILKRHTEPRPRSKANRFRIEGPEEAVKLAYHWLRSNRDTFHIVTSEPVGGALAGQEAYIICKCVPVDILNLLDSSKGHPLAHPQLQIRSLRSSASGAVHSTVSNIDVSRGLSAIPENQISELSDAPLHIASKHWTVLSFAEHLKRIKAFRQPTEHIQGVDRKKKLTEAVQELFKAVGFRSDVFSYSAMNTAIDFMLHNNRPREAEALLDQMERKGFPPTMDLFNTFLKYQAEIHHFSSFRQILKEAIKAGLVPNEGTWSALAAGAPGPAERNNLLRSAHEHGLTSNPAFAQEIALLNTMHSFGPFLDHGGSVTNYVTLQDELYQGAHWATWRVMKELVSVLANRGMLMQSVALIDHHFIHRGIPRKNPIWHVLLDQCGQQQKQPDLCVWMLLYGMYKWRLKVDDIVLSLVFKTAWRCKSYNLCKVIWKFAMIEGRTTFKVRFAVERSLAYHYSSSAPPSQTLMTGNLRSSIGNEEVSGQASAAAAGGLDFWRTAGAVICGQVPKSADGQKEGALPDETDRIMTAERSLTGSCAIPVKLGDLLVEALLLDKAWAEQGVLKTKSTNWLMANAIKVPIVRAGIADNG